MKKQKVNTLSSKLYKGTVTSLIGFTALTGAYLAYLTFSFVKNTNLQRKQRELAVQDQLLVDGAKELSN